MAGGIGTPVSPLVAAQIAARKKVIEKKVGRTNEDLLYLNAKTGWIKLSSSVNTLTTEEIEKLRAGEDPATIQGSNKLAGYNILQGGLLNPDRGLRQGIDLTGGYNENAAYNNRKDSTGIRPMPGITGMTVKSKNTYGTLREAEVKLICWTLEDFEMIEKLYLRPGYTVLLEWGHSMYIDNSGVLNKDIQSIGNKYFRHGVRPSQITEQIQEIRKATHNNYEGMIGNIQNFSWSYTADGAYDCSVSIISLGEVLESISLRFDPEQRGAIMANAASERGKEQRKSIYHNFISQIAKIEDASFNMTKIRKVFKPLGDALLIDHLMYFQNLQIDNYFRDDNQPTHWMSLRQYLDIFNSLISPVDTTKAKDAVDRIIVRFNTDYAKSSKFLTSPEHFSISPESVVLVKKAELDTGEIIEVENPQSGYSPNGDADDVLNIYISLPYLKKILDEALDENGVFNKSMHDITETILEGVNTALGGINDLGLSFDDEDLGGTWYIIDRNNTPEDSQDLPVFTLAGIGSVFTDVGISSKISNEMGSQISIAAQGTSSGTTEYLENILRWNTGIIDRLKTVKTTVDTPEEVASAQKIAKDLEKRTKNWLKDVVLVFEELNTNDGYDKEDAEALKTMHAEWTVANVVKKYRTQNKAAVPGLVPVELSFKIDGIGGFIIGQAFKIGAGILPSKYQDKFGYLITGIEHAIDSTNKWETSVTTQFYITEKPSDLEVQAAGQSKRDKDNKEVNKERKNEKSNPLGLDQLNNSPSPTSTPLLRQAVRDQAVYAFTKLVTRNKIGERVGLCAGFSFNIAYRLKRYLDTSSTKAIPWEWAGSGNADDDKHRTAIDALGIYDRINLGTFTGESLKSSKSFLKTTSWNYGDLVNYFSGDNFHTQIYTGDIFTTGMNGKNVKNASGNSGWTTSTATNYGTSFVYGASSRVYEVFVFKLKKQYLK